MTLKSEFHRKDEILFCFFRAGVKKPVQIGFGSVLRFILPRMRKLLSAALSQTVMYIFSFFFSNLKGFKGNFNRTMSSFYM